MALKQTNFLAHALAPEEIRPKQYVSVLSYVSEFFPFWCDEVAWRDLKPRRIEWLPCDEPLPLKVKAVCLPFVLVKSPQGGLHTMDVRRFRLAELDRAFGEQMYRLYREKAKAEAQAGRGKRSSRKKKS